MFIISLLFIFLICKLIEKIFMNKINILLLCGGDGSEHEISLITADFLRKVLQEDPSYNVKHVVIHNDYWDCEGTNCSLQQNKTLLIGTEEFKVDYVIPCIHGFPGETGDIQSLLEIYHIPYFGCDSWASKACFNKITTKLYMDSCHIPNTPYIYLDTQSSANLTKAQEFFNKYKKVFVKAASQGSSVGCYQVNTIDELLPAIEKAFTYSNSVLIEQSLTPRELEVATYEFNNKLIATFPGEIITPNNKFYTYEEKYNSSSRSETVTEAYLPEDIKEAIRNYALQAFKLFKLKDLSRIDFFLTEDGKIYLNEINTFPGMTPISMFPKMLAHHGENMLDFIKDRIAKSLNK